MKDHATWLRRSYPRKALKERYGIAIEAVGPTLFGLLMLWQCHCSIIAGTFTVGLLLGANVGFVVLSLFVSGRDHDRDDEPPTQ
jgi:hypothetical protein